MNRKGPFRTFPESMLAALIALALLTASPVPSPAQSSGKESDKKNEQAAKADKSDKESKAKKDSDSDITNLTIEITAGEKNEPVAQASVYVKYMEERTLRRDKQVALNLKTNMEGVARLSDAPRGKVLIQVIAPGWKTFGKWYDLDQAEQTVKIQLQKPPRWY